MSKYKAVKTEVDGIRFASKKEAARYCELKMLAKGGCIRGLRLQPEFEIQPSYKKNGKTVRKIVYKADFQYFDLQSRKWIVEDVKGVKTPVYKLKKKLVEYKYPDVTIVEV